MNILCTFHIFVYGYVTVRKDKLFLKTVSNRKRDVLIKLKTLTCKQMYGVKYSSPILEIQWFLFNDNVPSADTAIWEIDI